MISSVQAAPRSGFANVFGSLHKGLMFVIATFIALTFVAGFYIWQGVAWCASKIQQGAKSIASLPARVGQMKKTLIGIGVLAVGSFAAFYLLAVEVSGFSAALLKMALGCSVLYIIIRYGHDEIDTMTEIKEGNDAVANYFRNYALVIAAALFS